MLYSGWISTSTSRPPGRSTAAIWRIQASRSRIQLITPIVAQARSKRSCRTDGTSVASASTNVHFDAGPLGEDPCLGESRRGEVVTDDAGAAASERDRVEPDVALHVDDVEVGELATGERLVECALLVVEEASRSGRDAVDVVVGVAALAMERRPRLPVPSG